MPEIPLYKRILSYFYPVTIAKLDSKITPGLCVQMEAGKLLLNTANANYSYGNLHKVFEEVFEKSDIEANPPGSLLLLGLGSGSVIDILQSQYGCFPDITALEIDEKVLECLPFFENLNLENVKIIQGDAFETVEQDLGIFDLIVVDVFIDLHTHPKVFTEAFVKQLSMKLAKEGTVFINCMINNSEDRKQFAEFQLLLMRYFSEITGHEVFETNRVLELKAPY
jgi:cyclopropane fatty-acyl-phospholipid synthase-like methyltransferase